MLFRQERIDHGVLIRWTKGINVANTEGHDVAAMFAKSLANCVRILYQARMSYIQLTTSPVLQQLPIKLTALINDTTGTLIASHYVNPRTKIAVIFGTGCNAAYMERIKDIDKIKSLGIDPDAEMAINCEWVRFVQGHGCLTHCLTHEVDRALSIPLSMNTSRGQSMILLSTSRLINLANKLSK